MVDPLKEKVNDTMTTSSNKDENAKLTTLKRTITLEWNVPISNDRHTPHKNKKVIHANFNNIFLN